MQLILLPHCLVCQMELLLKLEKNTSDIYRNDRASLWRERAMNRAQVSKTEGKTLEVKDLPV
jgi:hypothetical protein